MSAIDIHGHVTSPTLFERLPMPPSLADVDGMIEQKAAQGIGTTIVGSPVGAGTMIPGTTTDADRTPEALEEFHDWIAGKVRDHPGALAGYVYTDPLGGDEVVARAARRLEQDEFVGLIVNTSVGGRYLDAPEAEPFFAMAAERSVPVLLHAPAEPIGGNGLGHAGLVEHIARPCDITIGVAALATAGWQHRFPELRLIVTAAGAGLPLLVEKLALAQRRGAAWRPGPPAEPEPGRSAVDALRRLYVDTTTPSSSALRAALDLWGPERVLFGTDSPPATEPHSAGLERLAATGLDDHDLHAVREGNARALFGLAGATHTAELKESA